MIVFISDLHLSDGTFDYHDPRAHRNDIAHDISEEAFALFWDSIYRIVTSRRESRIREITVVLLGDAFEMRSSTRWVASDYDHRGARVGLGDRPWREDRERPSRTCLEIFDNILKHNRGRLQYLTTNCLGRIPRSNGLRKLAGLGIKIRFKYLAGNHDRLLIYHKDPVLRDRLARELGWELVPPRGRRFPAGTKYVNSRLAITAEHGHRADKNDYFNDDFSEAPLGSITIDALGRLMYHLQKLGAARPPSLPRRKIRELVGIGMGVDNVRPSSDSYRWLLSRIPEDPETRLAFRRILLVAVGEFLEDLDPILDFVFSRTLRSLKRSRLARKFVRRTLRGLADRLARSESADPLGRIMDDVSRFLNRLSRWGRLLSGPRVNHFHANARDEVRRSPAKYVLYGHTHSFETVPLLKVGSKRTFYFNTGTWKKTLMKNLYDKPPRLDFQNWSRMTYILFFDVARRENKKHVFELWHGDQKFLDEN